MRKEDFCNLKNSNRSVYRTKYSPFCQIIHKDNNCIIPIYIVKTVWQLTQFQKVSKIFAADLNILYVLPLTQIFVSIFASIASSDLLFFFSLNQARATCLFNQLRNSYSTI